MREIEIIHKVLILLEKNYNRAVSPEELEAVSNYSYRNIQRVFKKIFRETIGEFQKRLRLENGFKRLIYSDESITDISFAIGYESNQAFTKAFKKEYQITPKETRLKKQAVFDDFINSGKYPEIKSEMVFLNKIEVFYKLIITNDYDNAIINDLWDKIYEQTNFNTQLSYYGIIVDQPLISIKSKSRYEACFSKQHQNIKGYNSKHILGGKYVKYTHFGSYDTILETYRLLYFDWLFNQNYEINSSPIVEHYEVGSINVLDEENYVTHILVPIK